MDLIASRQMKLNFQWAMAACLFALAASGCVRTLDGRKTMAMPFQRDTIQGQYQFPANQVWAAAKEALSVNGRLYGENTITKTLEANVDEKRVWLKVEEVEPRLTRVLIQSRSGSGRGDIHLASELDKQIALRLATGASVPAFIPAQPAVRTQPPPRPSQDRR